MWIYTLPDMYSGSQSIERITPFPPPMQRNWNILTAILLNDLWSILWSDVWFILTNHNANRAVQAVNPSFDRFCPCWRYWNEWNMLKQRSISFYILIVDCAQSTVISIDCKLILWNKCVYLYKWNLQHNLLM